VVYVPLLVYAPLYTLGVYAPLYIPGYTAVPHGEPGQCTRQHGEGQLATLTRGVTEQTVSGEPLTDTRFTVGYPSHYPFHCWARVAPTPGISPMVEGFSVRFDPKCAIQSLRKG